jgi:hypothetical protein
MKHLKTLIAAAALAVLPSFACAVTPTVEFLGAGSSAQWQSFAIGAYVLAGTGAQHFTVKGTCDKDCADLNDSRSSSISLQSGNLWVVWTSDHSKVWAAVSVDSVVGNRNFFATPRATLVMDTCYDGSAYLTSCTKAASGNTNLINAALLGGTSDTTTLPTDIFAALQDAKLTAALTDIRPEDALFAQQRVVSTYGAAMAGETSTLVEGLGYGTGPNTLVGSNIVSAVGTVAQPVAFALSGGKDPFTNQTVPASATISVGASPIVFFANRQNPNGVGKKLSGKFEYTDLPIQVEQNFVSGTDCVIPGSTIPVTVFIREPLSGTMNTTEYSVNLNDRWVNPTSQEKGIDGAKTPQLGSFTTTGAKLSPYTPYVGEGVTCSNGSGTRARAIGTGEMVKDVEFVTDSFGYTFWGYGNFSAIANNPLYGYVTLYSTDPIQTTYNQGLLPACAASGCPIAAGDSFPNVRSGKYVAWSILRVVTDAKGTTNYNNTETLVTAVQNNVNKTVPDYIPVSKTSDGDPGLLYYRSHYLRSGVAPNNGLFGATEAGGDVGGCIESIPTAGAGTLNCKDYK